MSKKKTQSLLAEADQVVDVGACRESPYRHAVLMKDGKPIGGTRFTKCEDGKPFPSSADILFCDQDGKIVDRMRTDGPAQVATPKYRQHYDQIFDTKKSTELN